MTWVLGNNVRGTYAPVLRTAGWHQTDTGLLWIPPTYIHSTYPATGVGSRSVQRQGIRFKRFELLNATAGAINLGIGTRYANWFWKGGTLSANGATYTDLTSSVQSTTAVAIEVTGANQTGFVIGCTEKFDWVSMNVTTAETDDDGGGEISHTVVYSTTAVGTSAFSSAYTLGYTDTISTTGAVWGAAARNFVWMAPSDWTKNNGALCGGDLDGMYLMRFTSVGREASDVAAQVTGIEIGRMHAIKQVASDGIFENEFIEYFDPLADGIVAYFSGAQADNRVYVEAIGG